MISTTIITKPIEGISFGRNVFIPPVEFQRFAESHGNFLVTFGEQKPLLRHTMLVFPLVCHQYMNSRYINNVSNVYSTYFHLLSACHVIKLSILNNTSRITT